MFTQVFVIGLALSSLLTTGQPHESLAAAVASKKWQRRVLLVYARDGNNADLRRQQRIVADQKKGLDERDLDQIVVLETDLSVADRQYLHGGDRKLPASATFMTYLIGKDGGVKQHFSTPVEATELFRIVDAMPMRQSEMDRTN